MTTIINGPGVGELVYGESRSLEGNQPITYARLAEILSGGPALPGISVSPTKAMQLTAVWACVNLLANAVAKMPLVLYQETDDGRERAKGHPYYRLLKKRPHPRCSPFSLVKTLVVNTLLWGRGHAEIIRRGDGLVLGLLPIETVRVQPVVEGGVARYRVATDRGVVTLQARDILHIPGLSYDGFTDLSVIQHARLTMAGAMAGDETSARMQAQGLRAGGVLEVPGKIGEAAVQNLRRSLEEINGGPQNTGRPMILEQGMVWKQTSINPDDAQFLESRKFSREEICFLFGVRPGKIGLGAPAGGDIEQASLEFLGDSVSPHAIAIEQEMNYKLFGDDDEHYAEFLTQALVQVDMNKRGQWYERMTRIGGMNIDEIRDRENMNRLSDGRGTVHYLPSNQMPAATPDQADRLTEAWITSRERSGGDGTAGNGEPQPDADGKVAGNPSSV